MGESRRLIASAHVGMFGTAGLIILIGAVLTIVLVGFILLWFAMILVAVASFSIRTQPSQPTAPAPIQTQG